MDRRVRHEEAAEGHCRAALSGVTVRFVRCSLCDLDFLGAARTVTGSRYLLTVGERRLLVDAGLFQGRRNGGCGTGNASPSRRTLTDIVLTHAHMDHCGYLPALVKQGMTAPCGAPGHPSSWRRSCCGTPASSPSGRLRTPRPGLVPARPAAADLHRPMSRRALPLLHRGRVRRRRRPRRRDLAAVHQGGPHPRVCVGHAVDADGVSALLRGPRPA